MFVPFVLRTVGLMAVLSVHLATRSWSDLGVALLHVDGSLVRCRILTWSQEEAVTVIALAQQMDAVCRKHGVTVLMLDGPQAWKADDNGFAHSRAAERAVNTAAKMGLPGTVLPGSYERFVGYCLALYDALARLGWQRLVTGQRPTSGSLRFLVESYPHAAWKSLGMRPLPARRRCRVSHLAAAWSALNAIVPIVASQPPNHNQMQAIVGGLPGLALAAELARTDIVADLPVGSRLVGQSPHREGGHWREGFIAVPVPPAASSIRWK